MLANYLDDDFTISANPTVAVTHFDILLGVTKFLGGKISEDKMFKCKPKGVVLGMLIHCVKGLMTCPMDKAIVILKLMREFRSSNGCQKFAVLQSWLGKISWCSYFSSYGFPYLLPLLGLQWMAPAERSACLRLGHPLYNEIKTAMDWWIDLLSGDRILWARYHDPKTWNILGSDASQEAWSIHDYKSIFLVGKFDVSDEAFISIKEMRAVTEYLRFAKPAGRSGFLLLCDNMQVCCAINKGAVGFKVDSKFRNEFRDYITLCERRCYKVVARWVGTHMNWSADLGSRFLPLIGRAAAALVGDRQIKLLLDAPSFNDAMMEILRFQVCHPPLLLYHVRLIGWELGG
jgi:hypothetical protein